MKRLIPGFISLFCALPLSAATLLVEAESFKDHGGWKLDTQFIQIMGSPYLLAHGLGQPVKDATTTVIVPQRATYHVWVRTKDWVGPWQAPGAPGKFQVLVNGQALAPTFGAQGAGWHWQDGGTVALKQGGVALALRDLTGFDGRCDAIVLTTDPVYRPANANEPMARWRTELLGLPAKPEEQGPFDLVVVGGGYGGTAAAISAARMGCKVALIQNRPVLGGNGSSEVRVWAMGGTRRGLYPNLGEIVEEFMDRAKASPAPAEQFVDDKKEKLVQAEAKISLNLNHHAFAVEKSGNAIVAVLAFDTRSGRIKRFSGKLFADCTGHGLIGIWAGADHTLRETGHLGMSNMWMWENAPEPVSFPATPWALNLTMNDFPYPTRFHGQWFWESGFNVHPLAGVELTRDWNLRAVFGAFNAMKNGDGASEHKNARLVWVAYVGGTRESTQLLGDVILTREDIESKKAFPDGCVPTTWDIDLHYPKEQYAAKFPDNPFISKAVFDKKVDREHGYPVPYRCFYSRNLENLFMAGRDVSVTHEALGTVRVMKTGGMIGEVVGKAASICIKHDTTPRAVYHSHLDELKGLMRLRGVARRDSVQGEIYIPDGAPELPPVEVKYLNPATLPGLVLDETQAKLTGKWSSGTGLKGYIGRHYSYAPKASPSAARFEFTIKTAGKYDVRYAYQAHENRASNAPITVFSPAGQKTIRVDMRKDPPVAPTFISLGVFEFAPGQPAVVEIRADDATGNIHADAVQLLPVK